MYTRLSEIAQISLITGLENHVRVIYMHFLNGDAINCKAKLGFFMPREKSSEEKHLMSVV